MYVSNETPAETEARLLRVLDRATFEVFDGTFAFDEFPVAEFPVRMRHDAFALVRDDEHWSQLVPSDDSKLELFTVFRFHFEPRLDNSGFVGWLATHLKRTVGTGVFVICGQNTQRGGIFDYNGCPVEVGDAVVQEIRRLITVAQDTEEKS